jgi:hypothetical protein
MQGIYYLNYFNNLFFLYLRVISLINSKFCATLRKRCIFMSIMAKELQQ